MPKNIAVFGAGTGLGYSVAHRFGREGYRAALIGRRQQRLGEVASGLAAAGIEGRPFVADLAKPDNAVGVVREIEATFGGIDVMYYGPLAGNQKFYPASTLDVPTEQSLLSLFFLTPIALVQQILPGMTARHDGAVLIAQGSTATDTMPGYSGVGPAMAATLNYVRTLFAEVAAQGVYAGTLIVRAGVQRSEMHDLRRSRGGVGASAPSVDPDELADCLWTMHTRRDRPDAEYPARERA